MQEHLQSQSQLMLEHGELEEGRVEDLEVQNESQKDPAANRDSHVDHAVKPDCRLHVESEVTESALRTLSMGILKDKGPLPVGEIAELLREITAISNLSTILKARFGGLKRLLEVRAKAEAKDFPSEVSTFHMTDPLIPTSSNLRMTWWCQMIILPVRTCT